MKVILRGVCASVCLLGATAAKGFVLSYPSVPVFFSGTVYWISNYNGNMNVPINKTAFTSKTLIALLNASSSATNDMFYVTGTNQIPKGSYFIWNPYRESLGITNKNGFFFPLEGSYNIATNTTHSYDYGYMDVDDEGLIGTYNLKSSNSAGSETDVTGIYFYFDDGNGNYLEIYGTATLNWTYGPVTAGSQETALDVSITGTGNDDSEWVDYYYAVPADFSAHGKGHGLESSSNIPFFYKY